MVPTVMAFFMSALLDNLTTTIVMVSLLRRILPNRENRMLLGSMVVVAANAGGAWTPMGDVTTTMLWIGGQVTTLGVMTALLIPSAVTMIVAVLLLGIGQRGHYGGEAQTNDQKVEVGARRVLSLGIGAFIFVPVFKTITHLPPSPLLAYTYPPHFYSVSLYTPSSLSRLLVSDVFEMFCMHRRSTSCIMGYHSYRTHFQSMLFPSVMYSTC